MVLCSNCGKDVNQGEFCSNCGSKLDNVKTLFCRNCGGKIDENSKICPHCGYHLIKEDNFKFCRNCGSKIGANDAMCSHCGTAQNIRGTPLKSVGGAIVLSLVFPGLGHFYIDQNHKAMVFVILSVLSILLMILVIGFFIYFVAWAWALIDVIKSTEAINNGEFVEDKLL